MNQPPVHFTYRLLSYLVSAIIAGQPLLPAVGAVITHKTGPEWIKRQMVCRS